jgi:hypothetical protein
MVACGKSLGKSGPGGCQRAAASSRTNTPPFVVSPGVRLAGTRAEGDEATIDRPLDERRSTRRTAEHTAIDGDDATGRATAAHALNTRLLEEIVRPRGGGTRIAVFSPIRGID